MYKVIQPYGMLKYTSQNIGTSGVGLPFIYESEGIGVYHGNQGHLTESS
jgi:hypothetical protein